MAAPFFIFFLQRSFCCLPLFHFFARENNNNNIVVCKSEIPFFPSVLLRSSFRYWLVIVKKGERRMNDHSDRIFSSKKLGCCCVFLRYRYMRSQAPFFFFPGYEVIWVNIFFKNSFVFNFPLKVSYEIKKKKKESKIDPFSSNHSLKKNKKKKTVQPPTQPSSPSTPGKLLLREKKIEIHWECRSRSEEDARGGRRQTLRTVSWPTHAPSPRRPGMPFRNFFQLGRGTQTATTTTRLYIRLTQVITYG